MLIRASEARRSETPAGVMTTLASPTQGGAERAIWRVEGKPGAAGPLHSVDVEQLWAFLDGEAVVELGEESYAVGSGDTVVMPGGVLRRLTAGQAGFTAVVTAAAGARASAGGKDFGVPPWIA
ncbi:cupin domain-containing protein [Thermoactinospora rubra]|uniref:cupin domain-containing protein n=1 Tax=Thermoactinospora rubra TaxID=1088767 RepID=UPI000A101933|nr:cupin domain-containing protein [Thermoactinospora rubra]